MPPQLPTIWKHPRALPLAQKRISHALTRSDTAATLAVFKDAIDGTLLCAGAGLFGHGERAGRCLKMQCGAPEFRGRARKRSPAGAAEVEGAFGAAAEFVGGDWARDGTDARAGRGGGWAGHVL